MDQVGSWSIRLVALLATCCLCWTAVDAYTWDDVTPLDEYVQSDDGYYSWTELAQYRFTGVTVYMINMTSQKYQDESFIDKSIWWHFMVIAIPDNIRYIDAGILFIDGGSNRLDSEIPPADDLTVVAVAVLANDTGCVAGLIKQVPNEPVVFTNDPSQMSRSEDRIIAWTWRTYIDSPTPDPTVILRMPMTKAAKRGLDTVVEVAKKNVPSSNIRRFMIAGASKRGWTTWSLACTDRRVVAMAPLVFSLLNIPQSVQNHFQNMDGGYSFAFEPYWNENLTQEFYNPKTDGVWDVEDMYRYRERLQGIPKIEMVSSGDEFFLCDDSLQWWNDMPGPKYMMMLPNAEHSMAPHYVQIYETAVSFWTSILDEVPLPLVSWSMTQTEGGGLIVFNTYPQPINITAFSATTLANDTRRDFRLASLSPSGEPAIHPIPWRRDVNVVDLGNGLQYGAAVEKVEGEWVGFFFQGTWEGPAPNYYRLVLTSQVNIVPDTHPRGPCLDNVECYGKLV